MDICIQNIIPKPLEENIGDSLFKFGSIVLKQSCSYVFAAPSGKGKSTLLSYLYGLRSDYKGSILYGNTFLQNKTIKEWTIYRQRLFAMVFQDLRLFGNLTAIDNIKIKNNLTAFKTETEIQEMANSLGVAELLKRKIKTLSMGQQQRIAIIRALCQPFDWVLLDEPFSHLDAVNTERCMTLIETECRMQKAGMILTSLGEDLHFSFDGIIGA